MLGKIHNIKQDAQHGFVGGVLTEDGKTYGFNKRNWANPEISFDDIQIDAEVEFELRKNTYTGKTFPKNIRFKGESARICRPTTFDTKHSHGKFNKFVYVKTFPLAAALKFLTDDILTVDENTSNMLYSQIARSYNELNDADFIFSMENACAVAMFPSGFVNREGQTIYLYCTENDQPDRAEWYCDRVLCNGHVIGGAVFDTVNANWYDIVDNLKDFIPTLTDEMRDVVRCIEDRCIAKDTSLIWLKEGVASTENQADHLYVPTGYFLSSGEELYLSCSRKYNKEARGYAWCYDCLTYENAPLNVYSKKDWLELWSFFNWSEIFDKLEKQTLDERWSFSGRNDYSILKNYLKYTFAHQMSEGAISYSQDGQYAVFNTGLPERSSYKYLYAFFERTVFDNETAFHPLHPVQHYRFRSFAYDGQDGDGKILHASIWPLPNPPQYFKARSQTVWELDFNDSSQPATPGIAHAHILVKQCDRIPLCFYRRWSDASDNLAKILNSSMEDDQKYKAIREFLWPVHTRADAVPSAEVSEVYSLLSDDLTRTVMRAIRKLSWNWRAVLPCYNPEKGENSFLLPVSFSGSTQPDRAMVATAHEVNGKIVYQIHTVLTLEMAYLDARLVCRPESEWLAVDSIG